MWPCNSIITAFVWFVVHGKLTQDFKRGRFPAFFKNGCCAAVSVTQCYEGTRELFPPLGQVLLDGTRVDLGMAALHPQLWTWRMWISITAQSRAASSTAGVCLLTVSFSSWVSSPLVKMINHLQCYSSSRVAPCAFTNLRLKNCYLARGPKAVLMLFEQLPKAAPLRLWLKLTQCSPPRQLSPQVQSGA